MDSVLIDTHVFIWLAEADPTLPTAIGDILENTDDEINIPLKDEQKLKLKLKNFYKKCKSLMKLVLI